jgi:hypothetical protein
MIDYLPKPLHDTLLIIHYGIDRAINKEHVEALVRRGLVSAKHPSGWMSTGLGRDYVRRLK